MSVLCNILGRQMVTDGRTIYAVSPRRSVPTALPTSGIAEIRRNEPGLEAVKAEVERLQAEFSNSLGRKVQFNVNQELDKVVVMIVDPSTNKVIKEIPSEDVQKLQIRMKQISALIIDETV